MEKDPSKKQFDYKWIIAVAAFLMVFTVLGFCSSSKSLYTAAITEALSISRSTFAINDSCRYIATSVVNVFFGALVARFGERKLIGAGFVCLIISMLLYSVGTNVFVFYLGGIFLGMGLSWTTTTMVGAIVGKWFKQHRGTVMGAILASNGIGAALAMQILSPMIYREDTLFGYRDAYRLVALILLAVGTVVVLLLRGKPKEATEDSSGHKKKRRAGESWTGISFTDAKKKTYFYAALACVFLTGMILQGTGGIAAPLLRDVGLDESYVATVLSVHSLALTVFKFGVGFIYDRFGLRITSNVCYVTAVAVIFLLARVTASPAGMVLAMIYGIFSSLALPLETIMLPIFASDLFGEKSYNKILGIFVSVNTAGYALGAPVTNLCYDLTGNYTIAIYIACGLMISVTAAMQFIINAAKKEKRLLDA